MVFIFRRDYGFLLLWLCLVINWPMPVMAATSSGDDPIEIRAWGVPDRTRPSPKAKAALEIVRAFRKKFPNITPRPATGLALPSARDMQGVTLLMQIAGDIAPDVLPVGFSQSHTFIENKFLYPLDKYIEQSLNLEVKDGHLLELDDYLSRLKQSAQYDEILASRVPRQCWDVMRRACPYKEVCPYLESWGRASAKAHHHVWCFPEGMLITAMWYRKDLFSQAGLPDRVPRDWDELLKWARKLTNPPKQQYGLHFGEIGRNTQGFLYSMGGQIVGRDEAGNWRCMFDSEAAVEAYYFVARLLLEPFENDHGQFTSVVPPGRIRGGSGDEIAIFVSAIDGRAFSGRDPNMYGFGPMPLSPIGRRSSDLNARMSGIYAGLDHDPPRRNAAWQLILFRDSREARFIRAQVYVENGFGKYIRPSILRAAGYDEYARLVPKQWEEAIQLCLKSGTPEPYGKNCQLVFTYLNQTINQIRTDGQVVAAFNAGDQENAKDRIRQILRQAVVRSNKKMLGVIAPKQQQFRNGVAWIVAVLIFATFVMVFRKVFRVFAQASQAAANDQRKGWQFARYRWAYLLMLPAVGSIAMWSYYPLLHGSVMAFENYNVRGFSDWVGIQNFATVLFDADFWFASWVSIQYTFLFVLFGFAAPIILAVLLSEVPRGKLLFRTIYYLPAVLTGVVVMFMWKGFYGPYGMINQLLNFLIGLLNHLPGIKLNELHNMWLDEPRFALFFCLLPSIWAGMGPGCLIYLAALKTVPHELYEAADIDGAGIFKKLFNVTIPSIKALIIINFIGAVIGAVRGGGEFILAMTGGGPHTPRGQTEVVGLHIYWQAFGYLRFGVATAMAWLVGFMLIGFTVYQLQRLSRMEFTTADTLPEPGA